MKLITRRGEVEIKTPTLNELGPLAGASLDGLSQANGETLSEGAQAIREAVLTVVAFPMSDTVIQQDLQRIQPPHELPGTYVINTAPGDPPLEYLYRSVGSRDKRSRVFVGRIKTCAQELAEAAGPASSPTDEIGPWLIQTSLLLRSTPPNSGKRFTSAGIETDIIHFVLAYDAEHGYPPTDEEIANHIGTVRTVIQERRVAMRERGLITWEPRKARTLRVLLHG